MPNASSDFTDCQTMKNDLSSLIKVFYTKRCSYKSELKVEGLLAITLDNTTVQVININEVFFPRKPHQQFDQTESNEEEALQNETVEEIQDKQATFRKPKFVRIISRKGSVTNLKSNNHHLVSIDNNAGLEQSVQRRQTCTLVSKLHRSATACSRLRKGSLTDVIDSATRGSVTSIVDERTPSPSAIGSVKQWIVCKQELESDEEESDKPMHARKKMKQADVKNEISPSGASATTTRTGWQVNKQLLERSRHIISSTDYRQRHRRQLSQKSFKSIDKTTQHNSTQRCSLCGATFHQSYFLRPHMIIAHRRTYHIPKGAKFIIAGAPWVESTELDELWARMTMDKKKCLLPMPDGTSPGALPVIWSPNNTSLDSSTLDATDDSPALDTKHSDRLVNASLLETLKRPAIPLRRCDATSAYPPRPAAAWKKNCKKDQRQNTTHSVEQKIFRCTICSVPYTSLAHLNRHMIAQHRQSACEKYTSTSNVTPAKLRPVECFVCSKPTNATALVIHLKNQHYLISKKSFQGQRGRPLTAESFREMTESEKNECRLYKKRHQRGECMVIHGREKHGLNVIVNKSRAERRKKADLYRKAVQSKTSSSEVVIEPEARLAEIEGHFSEFVVQDNQLTRNIKSEVELNEHIDYISECEACSIKLEPTFDEVQINEFQTEENEAVPRALFVRMVSNNDTSASCLNDNSGDSNDNLDEREVQLNELKVDLNELEAEILESNVSLCSFSKDD